jgi:phage terminase large subunit GpA-like protein
MVLIDRPSLDFEPREAEAREPTARKSLLDWLESEYFLSPKVHGLAAQWSRNYGPFWCQIAEDLDDAPTREVWVYAPAQSGKSTIMTGWMGHTVDCDPVPMALVMPREDDASERVETCIIPMFESNPRLLRACGGNTRNINIGKLTMFDRMAFYLMFATSAAALSGKAIGKIGCDEVGKWKEKVGKEADPVSLCRDRLETFKATSKLFGITTPVIKGDLADRQFLEGLLHEWWPRCVLCRQRHKVSWANVSLDKNSKGHLLPAKAYAKGERSRYVCPICKKPWSESQRWMANLAGVWRSEMPVAETIDIKSYHISALMLHPGINTIGYLASKWAAAIADKKHGKTELLQAFINSRLAETWEIVEAEPDVNRLTVHITQEIRGVVPAGGEIVTAAADVQLDHVWFAAFAWGYEFEGWLLDARRIETGRTDQAESYELLRPYFEKAWDLEVNADAVIVSSISGIDSAYRTDVVNSVCRAWAGSGVVPLMGYPEDRIRGRLYRTVKLTDDLTRFDINVDRLKDSIFRQLFTQESPAGGFIHLYRGIERHLLEQLASEKQIPGERGGVKYLTWVLKSAHAQNHLWDLCVYNRFLAEIAGVAAIVKPQAIRVERPITGRPITNKRATIHRHN